ncbi:MAG: flippase-like domain-containing protein [Deltaproteobacteria bacterium]|nr:flippase-like domain-containing protein [Deltaproteobacteria bacterium]MBW2151932.1 flippase-like domain-containing protein [Deltaproteobacteria bacterium]
MKRNITISLLLGIIVSAVALYLAFRNVPISELIRYLVSINYFLAIPSIAVALLSFVLRVFRWQLILASSQRVSFWRAFHPLMIGFMVNCILPGRLGEVARPVILRKLEDFPVSTGLATVAAERVFDISLLIALFTVVLATVKINPELNIAFGGYQLNRHTLELISSGMLKLCVVLIAAIFLFTIERTKAVMDALIIKIPSLFFFATPSTKAKVHKTISEPVIRIVDNFARGLSLVKHPKKIVACIGLSLLVWYLVALSIYIMALGCPGIDLSFLEITAVMIIICFFIALPSVPGFWGIWEAGGVFALSLFGVATKDAAGFTLANHAIQVIPVILIGFVSAVITGINVWRVAFEERLT